MAIERASTVGDKGVMPCWLKCQLPPHAWSSRFLGETTQESKCRDGIHFPLYNPAPFSDSTIVWQRSFPTVLALYHGQESGEMVQTQRWFRQTQSLVNPTHKQLLSQGKPEPQRHQDRASCKLRGQGRSCRNLGKIDFLECISQYPLWMHWLITAASVLQKIKSYFIYIYLFQKSRRLFKAESIVALLELIWNGQCLAYCVKFLRVCLFLYQITALLGTTVFTLHFCD